MIKYIQIKVKNLFFVLINFLVYTFFQILLPSLLISSMVNEPLRDLISRKITEKFYTPFIFVLIVLFSSVYGYYYRKFEKEIRSNLSRTIKDLSPQAFSLTISKFLEDFGRAIFILYLTFPNHLSCQALIVFFCSLCFIVLGYCFTSGQIFNSGQMEK